MVVGWGSDAGVDYEGSHKRGNTFKKCIIYKGADLVTLTVSNKWKEYWKTIHDNGVLFDFPVYQPCYKMKNF